MIRQLTRFILPIAIMLALAFLLKGHDTPGGGFVSGLAFAVASILAFAAYGLRNFQERFPIEPDRLAVFGAVVLVVATVLPMLMGKPMLTHSHGVLSILGVIPYKWSSTLLFEIGVVLSVAGGLAAAAMKLWAMSNTQNSGGD